MDEQSANAIQELLSTVDISRLSLGEVGPATIRVAALAGRLRVAAVTPSGQRLFTRADAEAWLAKRTPRVRRRSIYDPNWADSRSVPS